jgi:hypothetical protein
MYIANPIGLTAILILPLVVLLHVARRRAPVRRIAGVFLWRSTAGAAPHRPGAAVRSKALACDLIAAAALVALACDVRWGRATDQSADGSWMIVAVRLALAAAALASAAVAWNEWAADRERPKRT